ncbi:MAG: ABC transporter substrate-binding protein [Chloroflexi bacterium OHK40]
MTRRTPNWTIVALTIIAALLAACGGAPAAPAPTAAPEPTAAPTAPAPTAPAPTSAPAPTEAAAPTSAPAPAPTAAGGGTMTGAWNGPCCVGVDNLNPLKAGGDYHWLNKIYSHLVTYNVEYTAIVPDLAESWEISDDNLTWTFTLREGVTWHDGSPFTANDVAFSLEICLDPASGGCSKASQLLAIEGAQEFVDGTATEIAGIEVIDPTTIAITTTTPNAPFLDTLAETWILHEASLGTLDRATIDQSDYWSTVAIGTGPFKMSNHEPGQFTELVRFDDYFRGAPVLERLIRRSFADPAAALLALENGEIDLAYVTADEVARLRQNPNVTVIAGPSQVDNFLSFNSVKTPIFGDPRFRQAILYAIDREAIIETLYNGAATPVNCLYGNSQYIPDSVAAKYPYDPDQARALLEEIGFDGAAVGEIELSTYYNDPLSLDVMTTIQAYLADVGITVTPRQMDGPSWTKLYYEDLAFGASFAGGANGPDPHRAFQYFHSSSAWPKGTNNLGFANAELDTALEEGASTMDPAARAEIYQQACEIMSETLPWIFLWQQERYVAVSNRIQNFVYTPAPGGGSYYDAAELWSIEE